MPTIGHLGIALPINKTIMRGKNTKKIMYFSLLCSIMPDFDFIGYMLGIEYAHFFGHRGFSHSIIFSIIFAFLITFLFFQKHEGKRVKISSKYFLLLLLNFSLVGMSHGFFDMLTNGSLGVLYFAPFIDARFDFGVVLIEAMPLNPVYFISMNGPAILMKEILYLVLPSLLYVFLFDKILLKRRNIICKVKN